MIKKFSVLAILLFCINAIGQTQEIPLNPEVTKGKLDNGLTYFIQHNENPKETAYLYLVNKVGSLLEDDDQQGLAHFMEHMNFNGTTHFPKNELVDYLEKAGIGFGSDLNAYTSYNETVYMLPIPTKDKSLISDGLSVLRDWAQEATLTGEQINGERGVVLEEARARKGSSQRMREQYLPMQLNNSRYTFRQTIGKDSILKNFKPDVIRRFKNDWYRPDLQAIIVVGDIDAAKIKQLITEKFSDLKNPENERKRPKYSIPLKGQSQFMAVTDEERQSPVLRISYKFRKVPASTKADYLKDLKEYLFNHMMGARINEYSSTKTDAAFRAMGASVQPLEGDLKAFTYAVAPKDNAYKESFLQTWSLVSRAKKFGFTEKDLKLAKTDYLQYLKDAEKDKANTESRSYVQEYLNYFLKDEPAPGIDWEYDFVKANFPKITLSGINELIGTYLTVKDRDILILAPSSEEKNLPEEADVLTWMKIVESQKFEPFKDKELDKPLLANVPTPGSVKNKKQFPELGITELQLSNGAKVVLKPTDYKKTEIIFSGFSPGGTSLYDNGDYFAASYANNLISGMGAGDFSSTDLTQKLNGKTAYASTGISSRSESIGGYASPEDLETALQLLHLRFTQPRKDSVLFNIYMENNKEQLSNRSANPMIVFNDTVQAVMTDHSYRSEPATVEKLDSVKLDQAYAIYKERFADASGFTFVFVGNFEVDKITPLLERYIGSLPSSYKNEKARDLGIRPPEGHINKIVHRGKENKAQVNIVFSDTYDYNALNNLYLKALGEVLKFRMLKEMREAEGEVYSPVLRSGTEKNPENRYQIMVAFSCAPENVEHLKNIVNREMQQIREEGIKPVEVDKFKAAYIKNMAKAKETNRFWLSYIQDRYQDDEDILQIDQVNDNLAKVTPETLKKAAQVFLSEDNRISFELLPKKN